MKNDLFTAIGIAIIGTAISFIVCNIFAGEIKPVSIKTVDSSFSVEIAEPNVEVFNYKSVNPTVEVYVGSNECASKDSGGNCIYPDNNQNEPESNSDQGND